MKETNEKKGRFKFSKKLIPMLCSLMAVILLVALVPTGAFAEQADGESESTSSTGESIVDSSSLPGEEIMAVEGAQAQTYTVSFYDSQKSLFYQEQVQPGAQIASPANVPEAPEGTSFIGWFEEEATEAFVFDGSAVNANLNLYATYKTVEETPESTIPDASEVDPDSETDPDSEAGPDGGMGSFGVEPVEHTVTFMVGTEIYDAISVLHETLVTLPADPAGQGGDAFVGWYTQDNVPFNPLQLINEDITLTAKFSNTAALVTYLNVDGTVLDVVEGQLGQAVPAPGKTLVLEMGKKLQHWALQGTQEAYTGNLTGNITLVPILADISMAVFVTNGSEIEPQTGSEGFNATQPATPPTRDGYTFKGWSANEDGTGSFDFSGTPINGTVFIYAVWEAATANYTVNIWVEKVNIAGTPADPMAGNRSDYDLQYTAFKTGTTGETLKFDDTSARTVVNSAGTSVKNLVTYSTFHTSEERVLSPNGDIVINVFFNRTVFTYNFDAKESTLGGEIFLKDGTSVGGYYSVSVKLEQDISEIWPTKVTFSKTTNLFANWSGFYGLGGHIVSYSYVSVAFSANTAMGTPFYYSITAPKRYEVTLSPTQVANPYTETRYYYVELTDAEKAEYLANGNDLPGETVKEWTTTNTTYGGTRYYKLFQVAATSNQSGSPAGNAKNWPGRDIEGFETIGTTGTCTTGQFQQVELVSGKDYIINYFMPRKSNTLTLVTGSGVIQSPDSRLVLGSGRYTATIKYQEPLDSILPSDVTLANYDFEGWYLDEFYELEYTGGNMPGNNLTLYAKYRGIEVTVIYNDGQNIATKTYARGVKLNSHELQGTLYENAQKGDIIPGKGIFLGWYYDIGENQQATVEFPLGLTLTRDTYVLKAHLTPQVYAVTFVGNENNTEVTYATQSVTSGTNNTLAKSGHTNLVPPARANYAFKGWTTVKNGTVVNFTTATPVLDDITVYAVWELVDVSVTFETNGGSAVAPVTGLTPGSTITQPSTNRPGYSFGGWYKEPTFVNKWNFATDEVKSDITLYAQWDEINLKYYYNAPGTVSNPTPDNAEHSATVITTANVALKDLEDVHASWNIPASYRFTGWNTKADGSGTVYEAGDSFALSTYSELYAQWVKIYTVTYSASGSTSGSAPVDAKSPYDIGSEVKALGQGSLHKSGYKFIGWSETEGAITATYVVGAVVTDDIDKNIVLYPVWAINHTVNLQCQWSR